MKPEVVAEAARATLNGSIPFPEVVGRLIETGVEYYHVDYVARLYRFSTRQARYLLGARW